ncbi:HNH endonuclease signature motif containing protein [Brachybacterium paraconglomeratum]|uniref:HNH endonuclease n=1 Tax=Brachybacterium paraconglomeratum TaxID=173362 RepID=UPI0031EB40F4
MDAKMPNDDGDSPGGAEPRHGAASPSADVLSSVATQYADIDASGPARVLLAQVLAATLVAFTDTRAVRDPLPETAPGSPEEALAVLAGLDHLRASLAAVDATWQVAAEQRIRAADRDRGIPASKQGKGANQELGLARRVSPAASAFSLASARRLTQHMPGMVDSLWEGSVAEQQASVVAAALAGASPDTCARIDEMIHENPHLLEGKGKKRLRSDIDKLIQKLEPETSRARAERAARARHVTMTPLADGMARVTAVLRGIDAAGMMRALAAKARSLKAAGDRTPAPALEADLMVDVILHPHPHPHLHPTELQERSSSDSQERTSEESPDHGDAQSQAPTTSAPRQPRPTPNLDIGIVITDTALLGRDGDAECAQLEGYGTIPAHIVSDTLLGRPPGQVQPAAELHPDDEVSAVFRRLYTSPRTGELVAMESQARAFPAGLARMIRWRDTTCRTPWCNAVIRQSDHVIPYHRGGPTSFANGQGLCVRCNLLKELGLWVLTAVTSVEGDDIGDVDGRVATTAITPNPVTPSRVEPSPAEPIRVRPSPVEPSPAESSPRPQAAPRTRGTAASQRENSWPSQSPPAAWIWTSPHGAQGISPTPPLVAPHTSTAEDRPSDEGGSDQPKGQAADPPDAPGPASPA